MDDAGDQSARVLLVDDHAILRTALRLVLELADDVAVVGEAGTAEDALALLPELAPDVVLMDVRMPGTDGIAATEQIVALAGPTRVLVLTTVELDEVVLAALRAGAAGFLLKSVPREQLWGGIRAVAAGDALLAPSITRRLIERHLEQQPPGDGSGLGLSERQAGVVRLVAAGLTNKEIASRLHLAETTVKGYVSDVLARHGLRDRTQLVVLAYESGLVRPGQG